MSLDVAEVAPGLWIGAAPPPGRALKQAGFDAVVLCAREYQPIAGSFPGVEVIRAPFNDSFIEPMTQKEVATAMFGATEAAKRVAAGKHVLVSCQMGIDRSGLVTGLALWQLTGLSGKHILQAMRAARPGVLTLNPRMKAMLISLPAARR